MAQVSQTEVVNFLADPASHGGSAVTRIDTHASVVFLAGDLAYKLKRAIRYSYLDYSTVEARRRACEAELALNRRTAPEIYLRVSPICKNADGVLQLDGSGTVIDWVVVMRRFDDELLFDRLAQRGSLTLGHMLELAGEVADFHRAAEVDRQAGGAMAIAEVIRGNLANLSAHAPGIFAVADIEALRQRSEVAMGRVSGLLDRRRAEGCVRLCHGDLHLRNVCLIAGRPVLFDCIEFSRELACIDVLYDLAFLLMDLEERHLRPLANAVFNRYLDLTDEGGGSSAIPLFLSIRAAVRAHVTATAAKLNTVPETRDRLAAEARQYLQLALELIQPVGPVLIAIGGLSGTGKTTLAYNLAPRFGAAPGARVLRTDILAQAAGWRTAYRAPAGRRLYRRGDTTGLRSSVRTVCGHPGERPWCDRRWRFRAGERAPGHRGDRSGPGCAVCRSLARSAPAGAGAACRRPTSRCVRRHSGSGSPAARLRNRSYVLAPHRCPGFRERSCRTGLGRHQPFAGASLTSGTKATDSTGCSCTSPAADFVTSIRVW